MITISLDQLPKSLRDAAIAEARRQGIKVSPKAGGRGGARRRAAAAEIATPAPAPGQVAVGFTWKWRVHNHGAYGWEGTARCVFCGK